MPRSKRKKNDLLDGSFTGKREPLFSVRGLGLIIVAASTIVALFFVGEYVQRVVTYRSARDPALDEPHDPES